MSLLRTLQFITSHPLNRRRKIAALLNFLKWQIGCRIVPGPVIYNWVDRTRVILQPGETGLTGNLYCGLQEFTDMAYVLHVVSEDDLFVDVGANVGAYTILACGVKGARGISVEPVPSTYRRLLDNIRLNDLLSRVTAYNVGVSDREGDLFFTSTLNCTNHVVSRDEEAADVARVTVTTLDNMLLGRPPTMIKIDVEGYEGAVIAGAHSILGSPSLHSVIMEFNGSGERYGYSEDKLIKKMLDFGFVPCVYNPFLRNVDVLADAVKHPANILFIRDIGGITNKAKMAPTFMIGRTRI